MKKLFLFLVLCFIFFQCFDGFADSYNSNNSSYLFSVHAKNGYIKKGKLFLNNVGPSVTYFSDRPQRIAGHMDTDKFLMTWRDRSLRSPNIIISFKDNGVYADMTLEVGDPLYDGNDISFHILGLLESDVPVLYNKKLKFNYPEVFIDGDGCWVMGGC